MLFGLLLFLFLLVCVILVFLILVQDDKGGGISGAIGGGISSTANTVLGSQNAENILTHGTRIFAGLFFVLTVIISLLVANYSDKSKGTDSGMKDYVTGVSDVVAPAAGEGAIMPFVPSVPNDE